MLSVSVKVLALVLMGSLLVCLLGVQPGHTDSNLSLQSSAERSSGEIDFETFRLISTGMTRQEVLNRPGHQPSSSSVMSLDSPLNAGATTMAATGWQKSHLISLDR